MGKLILKGVNKLPAGVIAVLFAAMVGIVGFAVWKGETEKALGVLATLGLSLVALSGGEASQGDGNGGGNGE